MEIIFKKSANKQLSAKSFSLNAFVTEDTTIEAGTHLVLISQTATLGTVIDESKPELTYKISMEDWLNNTTKVESIIV